MKYITWLTNNNWFKVWAVLALVVIFVDVAHTSNWSHLNLTVTVSALIGHLLGAGFLALIFELLRFVFTKITNKAYEFRRYPRFILALSMVMEVQTLIQIIQNTFHY